ncbi:MAG: DUF4276 family protein [Chloroflexi bacterium]|nr:DUF4276 family protein [Chloroflexota bacterium]
MTHLLILCEGEVEARVLKFFLRPYWQVWFRTLEVQRYDGNGELRAKFKADSEQQLTQEPESSVLCLLDLYEEPFGLYQPPQMTVEEGFTLVQKQMYQQIKSRFHPRFGAFPVVMEIETWLLADSVMQHHLDENIPSPERIEHPSGYLEKIYRSHNSQYGKISDGVSLFGKADAKRVFDDDCPHFEKLVDWLINPPNIPDEKSATLTKSLAEWEAQRDAKYAHLLQLQSTIQTEADLTEANMTETDNAKAEYYAFLQTRSSIFKDS